MPLIYIFLPLSISLLFFYVCCLAMRRNILWHAAGIARKNAKKKLNYRKNIKKIENLIPAVHMKKKAKGIYNFV